MTAKEEWVRVESFGEFRVGMAIQHRPCMRCGTVELGLIVSIEASPSPCAKCMDECIGVRISGGCHCWDNHCCMRRVVADGRLYRLRDLPDAQSTEAAKPREREVVR